MTSLQIKNKIELDFGITIKKQCKLREYVYPRAIYFKLCREYTELTLQELAESVGTSTRTTTINLKGRWMIVQRLSKRTNYSR